MYEEANLIFCLLKSFLVKYNLIGQITDARTDKVKPLHDIFQNLET